MHYDVVVVGAGPAGLAAAIRLKSLAPDTSVVVVEKGSPSGRISSREPSSIRLGLTGSPPTGGRIRSARSKLR